MGNITLRSEGVTRFQTPFWWAFLIVSTLAAGSSVLAQSEKEDEVLTLGLSHLGLTVRDLEKSVGFFTETLGWKVVGGDEDYPSVFVSDGGIFLTLWRATDPEHAIAFDRKNNIGLHHLALTVRSREALDVLHERFLETEGVVIEFAPELNRGGPMVHMMIREPSGNRLEFAYNPERNN